MLINRSENPRLTDRVEKDLHSKWIFEGVGWWLEKTDLPTAFLLVNWWRDDTEELRFTLYKASLSTENHSVIEHYNGNLCGSSRETTILPSIMSEVWLLFPFKQRSGLTQLRTVRALKGSRVKERLWTRRVAVVDGLKWWDFSSDMCCGGYGSWDRKSVV